MSVRAACRDQTRSVIARHESGEINAKSGVGLLPPLQSLRGSALDTPRKLQTGQQGAILHTLQHRQTIWHVPMSGHAGMVFSSLNAYLVVLSSYLISVT